MTKKQKQALVVRVNTLKEYRKMTSEAIDGIMAKLVKCTRRDEILQADGKYWRVADAFEGGDTIWRPARVARYHLVEEPRIRAKGKGKR